ncbi:hypothetical protein BGX26_011401 [Mortierella sp. AD094]|nr:hypothetical protein BGX26_011401 [Mortierella sp. AD094]
MYVLQGSDRPFSILEHEELNENGAPAPTLCIYSTVSGMFSIDNISYSNKTGETEMPISRHNGTLPDGSGETICVSSRVPNLKAGWNMESIKIVIRQHNSSAATNWTFAGLVHPQNNATELTSEDTTNRYFFYTGHIIEIRYAALHRYQAYRPVIGDPIWKKIKAFLGYGGQIELYSYKSSVDHIPFANGAYDNTTTVIVIRPLTDVESITYAVEKTTFRDTLAKIGGLMGIIASVIIYLFGHTRFSPWGAMARFPPFKSLIISELGEVRKGYRPSNGPFTVRVEEIGTYNDSMSSDVNSLKERLDELEVVLAEYYLESQFFFCPQAESHSPPAVSQTFGPAELAGSAVTELHTEKPPYSGQP